MTALKWDQIGERRYETGADHGVLYIPDNDGVYSNGYSWNGLTTVTESPSGAEPQPQYADNIKYVNLLSYEEFGGTIEALTYPNEFGQCDGTASPQPGVIVGQQPRKTFGFSWRTIVGNDVEGGSFGYKIHLVYGALAAPSEKAFATVNDSPEAIAFSWDFTTTPVEVVGYPDLKPTSYLCIDSTQVDETALGQLLDTLYGGVATDPVLPSPGDVLALFDGSVTVVTATTVTYNSGTHTITIPTVTGVTYYIDGEIVSGTVVLTVGQTKVVEARPNTGYVLSPTSDDDWVFSY